MRAVFDPYGPSCTTGPLPQQVASAWWKVVRLPLPNDLAARPAPRAGAPVRLAA